MAMLSQIAAVTSLNVRSIPQRAAMSIASVVAVALAIAVLLFFLALSNGLSKTVSGSGADDVAIVLREGSGSELNSNISREQIAIVSTGPGIVQRDGKPLVSAELMVIVDGKRRATGVAANMPFRGIGAEGLALRRGVQMREGRMMTPGTNEIVVGTGLLREFAGFEYGQSIRLRGGTWTVVGVFESPGTVYESELWADAAVAQSLFQRGATYQTIRVQLANAQAVAAFNDWVKNDPRLQQLTALSEREYFRRQAADSSGQFTFIAWALGVTMAIGALAGALNTMYSSVAARAGEIATLRIIGFSGFAAFAGTMVEALALSALGGVLGIALSFLAFSGRTTSTLGAGFTQLVFRFELSPPVVLAAIVLAIVIGFLGGLLPGLRAARQRPMLELAAQ
jgi:putative ABC transport system permease protein